MPWQGCSCRQMLLELLLSAAPGPAWQTAEPVLVLICARPAFQSRFGFSFWVLLRVFFFPLFFFPLPVACTMQNLSCLGCDRLVIIYCHLQWLGDKHRPCRAIKGFFWRIQEGPGPLRKQSGPIPLAAGSSRALCSPWPRFRAPPQPP